MCEYSGQENSAHSTQYKILTYVHIKKKKHQFDIVCTETSPNEETLQVAQMTRDVFLGATKEVMDYFNTDGMRQILGEIH